MHAILERNKCVGWKNDWISVYHGFRKLNFKFGPASYFDNRWFLSFSLIYWQFYIHLPIRSKYNQCDPPQYGFYFYSNNGWWPTTFAICKGNRVKFIPMPWEYDWVRTSNLRIDGIWEHEVRGDRKDFYKDKWKEIIWSEVYNYTYMLKSGLMQYRKATVTVEEREWRPIWFKWTGLFKRVRKTISVAFNDEVGEGTGSWKGGCTGCGYEVLPGELPEQTLRRMERDRKFTR